MNKDVAISVFEVVGNPLCVASSDGQKLHDRLAAALNQGCRVSLSFRNISTLTSAFLNAAVGQLYGAFDEQRIRALLKVEDMEVDDVALLKASSRRPSDIFRTRRDSTTSCGRCWRMAMARDVSHVEDYDFTSGDEVFFDTNDWLFIYGPHDPADARVYAYSSALRRLGAGHPHQAERRDFRIGIGEEKGRTGTASPTGQRHRRAGQSVQGDRVGAGAQGRLGHAQHHHHRRAARLLGQEQLVIPAEAGIQDSGYLLAQI